MKTAMILAAGFGTRLRPYTTLRPKPLFPVMGKPLILHTIQQLRQAGFTRIIVNAHYLAHQISTLLGDEPDIIIQHESIELGTGGGLHKALRHFGSTPVLITNGDIYHDIDYDFVYQKHLTNSCPITMVMHDYLRFNKVLVCDNKVVSFTSKLKKDINKNDHCHELAFTGIHIIDPAILENIPSGISANIIDHYKTHLVAKGEIGAVIINDFWRDMGTPEDYLALHGLLLKNHMPDVGWLRLAPEFFQADNARIGRNLNCLDWGFIGSGVTVGNDVTLQRVVVWDGANIPAGTRAVNKIITN